MTRILTTYVYISEVFPVRWRAIVGVIAQMSFCVGYALLAPMAYYFPNYKHMYFITAIFSVPPLFFWNYFPESPRWLVSKRLHEKAADSLKSISEENGIPFDVDEIEIGNREVTDNHGLLANIKLATKNPKSIKYFFALTTIWITVNVGYYAFSFGLSSSGINMYYGTVLYALSEVAAYVVNLWSFNYGRKINAYVFCIATELALGAIILFKVPQDGGLMITVLSKG